MTDKKRIGLFAAGIGASVALLGLVFYKMFPKMKECCGGITEKCCGGEDECCQPEKKKRTKK